MQLLSWCWQRPIHRNTCPRGDVLVILICWCLWGAFPNRISSKGCPNFLSPKGFFQGENALKSVSAADRTPLAYIRCSPDLLVGSGWDTLSIYSPPLDAFVFSISARTAPRLSTPRENCTNPALPLLRSPNFFHDVVSSPLPIDLGLWSLARRLITCEFYLLVLPTHNPTGSLSGYPLYWRPF